MKVNIKFCLVKITRRGWEFDRLKIQSVIYPGGSGGGTLRMKHSKNSSANNGKYSYFFAKLQLCLHFS